MIIAMPLDRRENLSPSHAIAASSLFLLSIICSLDHALAQSQDSQAIPPAMAAFFGGGGGGRIGDAVAKNATVSPWEAARSAKTGGRDRGARTVLMVAGVASGAVGIALLAAAVTAYAVQARRAGPAAATGPSRRTSGPEARCGAA